MAKVEDSSEPAIAAEPCDQIAIDPMAAGDTAPCGVTTMPFADASESLLMTPAVETPRLVFAKLYEDLQKIDSRTRWSIGDSRGVCNRCQMALNPADEVHSVLEVADADAAPGGSAFEDPLGLFERRDYCTNCMPHIPLENAFAFWKSTGIPEAQPLKKVVNLASLLAYFERIAADDADSGERSENIATELPERSLPGRKIEPQSLELRYLIGLYLVRKRVLKLLRSTPSRLTLVKVKERQVLATFTIAIPRSEGNQLESGFKTFEELFK